jgi:hypothetical protein
MATIKNKEGVSLSNEAILGGALCVPFDVEESRACLQEEVLVVKSTSDACNLSSKPVGLLDKASELCNQVWGHRG